MAVFRIEKTRDYTVMSNYHLRDMSLSLKAKGLLSLMLSLPENWDYTMKGLARICKDGIDSISGGIRELEAHGYPGITLESAIPCESQAAKWSEALRDRYFDIASKCDMRRTRVMR